MAIYERRGKDGVVTFQVRERDASGKWFPAQSFEKRRDAERCQRELKVACAKGQVATSSESRSRTVGDGIKRWAAERRGRVSNGWKISQDQILRDYILPEIGTMKLMNVRPEDIGRMMKRLQDAGRSGQTRLHVYGLLHRIFGDFEEYFHWISRSPVTKRDRPEVQREEREFLKPDEARMVLAACRDEYIGPAVWLGILAGLRTEAIQALRVGAVDFEASEIRILAGYKRKAKETMPYPKGKRIAKVPMVPPLRDYLRQVTAEKSSNDYVIGGLSVPMLSHSTFLDHLSVLCKRLGVTSVTPHELRHSCSEIWFDEGASQEDVRRVLNHASLASLKPYIHRTDDRLHLLAAKIMVPGHITVSGGAPGVVKPPSPTVH